MRVPLAFAFDRASTRRYDVDGRLHVEAANLTRGCVNAYVGREIPGFEALGLEAERIYQLLRDPDELEKSVDSFNSLPVLRSHYVVNAADPRPDLTVGATGTDARFDGTFLTNSLVVWEQRAIDAIESGETSDLSCGYRYRPLMEPGTYNGAAYEGRMVDIVGSHLALVPDGRVSGCLVADYWPTWMPREGLGHRRGMIA